MSRKLLMAITLGVAIGTASSAAVAAGETAGEAVRHPIRTMKDKMHSRDAARTGGANDRAAPIVDRSSRSMRERDEMRQRDRLTAGERARGGAAGNDVTDGRDTYRRDWEATRDRALAWVHRSDASSTRNGTATRSGAASSDMQRPGSRPATGTNR